MAFPNSQSNPTGAIPVYQGASNVAIVTASGQIKTGAGVLQGINLGAAGASATVSFYDGTNTSGKLIWSCTANAMPYDAKPGVAFMTGLYVNVSATSAPSLNVTYI